MNKYCLAMIFFIILFISCFYYLYLRGDAEGLEEKKEENVLPKKIDGRALGVVEGRKFKNNPAVPINIKKSRDGKIQGIEVDGHDMTDQILYSPHRSLDIQLTGKKEGFGDNTIYLDKPRKANYTSHRRVPLAPYNGRMVDGAAGWGCHYFCGQRGIDFGCKDGDCLEWQPGWHPSNLGEKCKAVPVRAGEVLNEATFTVGGRRGWRRGGRSWIRAGERRGIPPGDGYACNIKVTRQDLFNDAEQAYKTQQGEANTEHGQHDAEINNSATSLNNIVDDPDSGLELFGPMKILSPVRLKQEEAAKALAISNSNICSRKKDKATIAKLMADNLEREARLRIPASAKNATNQKIKSIKDNEEICHGRGVAAPGKLKKWQSECRRDKKEDEDNMDENQVEQTAQGSYAVIDKCEHFKGIKDFFTNIFAPSREGFGEDCDLDNIGHRKFEYITKDRYKIVTSGFSHKKDFVGSSDTASTPKLVGCGFYCDGSDGCSTKMKSNISRLEKGRNYKISIWGWETTDNNGKHINHEPVQFDILANGKKLNLEPIVHVTSKLPKDPSSKYKGKLVSPLVVGIATAVEDTASGGNPDSRPTNGWGKIDITWSVRDESYCYLGTNCKGGNKDTDNHGHVPYSNIQITEMEMAE